MKRAGASPSVPAVVRAGYAIACAAVLAAPFAPIPAATLPVTAMVLATALCLWRVVAVRRERAAWALLGGALVAWTAGDVLTWIHPPTGRVAAADVAYFCNYALGYVGHLVLLRSRVRPFRRSMALDGVVIGLTLAAAATLLRAHAQGPALALVYPVADVILASFVVLVVALLGLRPGAAWLLILGGLALSTTGDTLGAYWLLPPAGVALSLAAWAPAQLRRIDERATLLTWLTVALGAVALGLLAWSQVSPVPPAAGLLAVGAVAAALLRGALAFRENTLTMRRAGREAHTDPLSGLGNRRALLADLDVACGDGGAHTLAFFDLDGFKRFNDTYGHGAGDDLLSLLAGDLRDAAGRLGRAYRLGGDEFCVLADGALAAADPRMRAVRDALTHAAGDMAVAASQGLVHLPAEADTPSDALAIADERMYADKTLRRAAV